jgi:FAD/FMN-containing dehydrogenase
MEKYGAACDNLLSAQVVTVDGRQVEASPKSNPDLFWAIRGGGGNFGVVTALEYQLHPVDQVLSGSPHLPARTHSRSPAGFRQVSCWGP